MGRNIEIKARVADPESVAQSVAEMADSGPVLLRQEDHFFRCPNGRLKLRILSAGHGELIFYQRPDAEGPRTSQYQIVPTDNPRGLLTILAASYGVLGIVRKTRTMYMVGSTRVHLDTVENLGYFLELEVMLNEEESEESGRLQADRLMERLRIRREDLIAGAYVDLLREVQQRGTGLAAGDRPARA